MISFWKQLPTPFFVLAPMADVTDVVFRDFVFDYSRPDVLYTEFVACKGLLSEKGYPNLERDLWYTKRQRPIVAQVFGSNPEDFFSCAQLVRSLGFDGMDINMGCPDRTIEKQGAGACLMRDSKRARAIIDAAKEGLSGIPLSVKTRIGYNRIETEPWITAVVESKPEAIIVHGRTRKEMSLVPTHWEEIALAARIAHGNSVLCIGNGDVTSRSQGVEYARRYGVDGIMIGRGVFGNPWVFGYDVSPKTEYDKLVALADLVSRFDRFWGTKKNYAILKKYFKSYVEGFFGSKSLRILLMETTTTSQALEVLATYFTQQGWKPIPHVHRPLDIAESFRFARNTKMSDSF